MADKQKAQPPPAPAKPKIVVSEKDLQAALHKIDNAELSEPEDLGFEDQRTAYNKRQLKRWRSLEELEAQKRKVSYVFPCLPSFLILIRFSAAVWPRYRSWPLPLETE